MPIEPSRELNLFIYLFEINLLVTRCTLWQKNICVINIIDVCILVKIMFLYAVEYGEKKKSALNTKKKKLNVKSQYERLQQ